MPRTSSGQLSTAFVLSIEQFKAEHEVPCSCNWLSDAEHSRATRRTSRLRTCGEPALLCSLHSPMERRCLVLEYLVHATTSPTLRRGRGTSKKWSCCLPQRKGWALRSFSGTACIARHLSTLQRMPPNSTPICIANPNLSGNCKGHYSLATQCLTGPQRCSQT